MLRKQADVGLRALKCRRGAAMIEYALLAGLVALVCIASLTSVGTHLKSEYIAISSAV